MTREFTLPDLGEGLTEAEIVAWHVSAGDHVVTGQPLVSVETDKAVVEVPSPRSGHVAAIHGEPGDRIEVGAPLVEFTEGESADSGVIVGDVAPAESAPAREPEAPAATGPRIAAAPAARARARELGVDIASVTGSGKDGAVTVDDVEAAARAPEGAERVRGVRRAMLLNMTRAGREVVPATVTDEADIDDWPEGTDVTVRLVQALAAGCRASPALNAWLDADAGIRTVHESVNVGIAMETDDGLFTPVLRDAGNAAEADLRRMLEEAKTAVRDRSIARADLLGQTISLSNFGMFGGRFASLVVVPPQVAILGAGRAAPRAVPRDGAVAVRRMLPLSLTFDHRAVTGVEAARFLDAVKRALEASG